MAPQKNLIFKKVPQVALNSIVVYFNALIVLLLLNVLRQKAFCYILSLLHTNEIACFFVSVDYARIFGIAQDYSWRHYWQSIEETFFHLYIKLYFISFYRFLSLKMHLFDALILEMYRTGYLIGAYQVENGTDEDVSLHCSAYMRKLVNALNAITILKINTSDDIYVDPYID